ncbi:MAG: IclR family transcriptional regulator [Betaproteobacteria bacterium]|nr:IclR family transcriptional regulator [Betaproteobacteria bacterium]
MSENIFHQSFHHWRIAIAVQSPKYATPALDKGLEILELLARSSRGLTLNEMSKAMGRTVSEIFRMVFTLEQRGYIASDDNDRYSLSLKMFELSHRQQPLKSLVVTAMPLMRELAGRACQSCHLVVYHDGRTIVVSQVDSPGPFTFGPKVGTLSRLTDTASGTILLAFVDEAERTRMIAALAALTVPYVERLDRLQSPSLVAVQEQVREVTLRLSELMSFSGHNTLQ